MTQDEPDMALLEFVQSEVPDFMIYEYAYDQGVYYIYGDPKNRPDHIIRRLLVPLNNMGYNVQLDYELGENVLIITPMVRQRERVWLNVVLAFLTVVTTMFAGSLMFGADPLSGGILKGIPFTLAIMFVLGSHEMGHYIVAKLHGMRTSLPYFIPFPGFVGTLGAVIKNRGPIPNRKALFDVGVAGPVAGLVASVIVTYIGLTLPPAMEVTDGAVQFKLSIPPLFGFISNFTGGLGEDTIIHPVAFAGWVGMLVTTLNLIPAGQLDGGHIMRAIMGKKAAYVSIIVPFVLLFLWLFVSLVMQQNGTMWLFWGLFIMLFAALGHPEPLEDTDDIGSNRMVLSILVFAAGLMCATLAPIQI